MKTQDPEEAVDGHVSELFGSSHAAVVSRGDKIA